MVTPGGEAQLDWLKGFVALYRNCSGSPLVNQVRHRAFNYVVAYGLDQRTISLVTYFQLDKKKGHGI